ncbi:hypothetical protein E8E13_004321 [Curvularia kusanoi]|uniref:RING-type domain-containing protein n=1 Tax=Curvularia kusanoi TaxID=90978 RepID=A0A9P4WC63_CURKU|nr:hypothetical protein E8E13_004321 [Curvularia kusanoi]
MPRPLRLLVSLTTTLLAVTLLLYFTLGSAQHEQKLEGASRAREQSSVNALFSFTSPGSLFPPSAIISLTDDNSTFFLARPAAFGPDLPSDGLSGPLWIGSGFGDDALSRGELGCSDIPGWDGGSEALTHALKPASAAKSRRTGPLAEKKDTPRRAALEEDLGPRLADDGTDDHLHQALEQGTRQPSHHADIQSLQESAEIAGKVVLLKRGGCGFLAKVEWAQRRGGVAVIVGDDVRGGGLIRMYARGDTSNVSIPSLFTSHTTAHLLSSLLPSGKTLSGGVPSTQKDKSTPAGTPASATPSFSAAGHSGPLASPEATSRNKSWIYSLLVGLGIASVDERPEDFTIGKDDWRDPKFRNLPTTTLPAPSVSSPTSSSFAIGNRGRAVTKYTEASREKKDRGRSLPGSSRRSVTSITTANNLEIDTFIGNGQSHEGLWVTLTPTNVSSSPFFDTLLVLVSHSSTLQAEPEAPATSSSVQRTARDREEEKREAGLAEWRRRYGGRQKECVVCLEEYVDGVSQVMSLPCGHEFHVDCITPWLAYLDRPSSPPSAPRLADDENVVDALQVQAAETRNESPSASRPLSRSASAPASDRIESNDDLEANWSNDERQSNAGRDIPGSRATELSTSVRDLSSTVSTVIWRGLDAVRSTTGLQRRPPPEDVDRDR